MALLEPNRYSCQSSHAAHAWSATSRLVVVHGARAVGNRQCSAGTMRRTLHEADRARPLVRWSFACALASQDQGLMEEVLSGSLFRSIV